MINITADGTYDVDAKASSVSMRVDGTFGGASVEVGFTSGGAFKRFLGLTAQNAEFEKKFNPGQGIQIQIRVTGSGVSTSIDVLSSPF